MGELWMGMCSSEWYLERSGHKIVFNYDNDLPIDTVACKNVRIKSMVVPNWHFIKIGDIVHVRSPVVIQLLSMFHRTSAHTIKVPSAALSARTKQIVLLITVDSYDSRKMTCPVSMVIKIHTLMCTKKKPLTHPGRIVPSVATAIPSKIRIVVIVCWIRVAMPRLVTSFWVYCTLLVWTI